MWDFRKHPAPLFGALITSSLLHSGTLISGRSQIGVHAGKLGVSKNQGPQHRRQNTRALTMRTLKTWTPLKLESKAAPSTRALLSNYEDPTSWH